MFLASLFWLKGMADSLTLSIIHHYPPSITINPQVITVQEVQVYQLNTTHQGDTIHFPAHTNQSHVRLGSTNPQRGHHLASPAHRATIAMVQASWTKSCVQLATTVLREVNSQHLVLLVPSLKMSDSKYKYQSFFKT